MSTESTTASSNELNVKTEVKVEAEEQQMQQRSVIPPPNFVNTQMVHQNAIFFKTCFDMIRNRFAATNIPSKPDPFIPYLMPDPYTLRAFANYKKEYEQFAKERNLNPYILSVPGVMPQNTISTPIKPENRPVPLTITRDNDPIIKKEEEDEEAQLSSVQIRIPKSPEKEEKVKKVPKKKAQNRIKNIPGLVVQRVRSSIKNYYSLNPKIDKHERRLGYVHKILSNLNKSDKERLLNFLEAYLKNWKTWNTIQKYLHTDLKYGGILLDVVLEFFGEDGEEDFKDWLVSGKMGDKSKAAVTELKERIKIKFSKIMAKPDNGEGEGEEEEIECLPKKMVKKEEDI